MPVFSAAATRLRVIANRLLGQFGLRPDAFLVIIAGLIGLVTAAAAVSFHLLVVYIRDVLYQRVGEDRLYGSWMFLLVLWPMLGGLVVGVIVRYIVRAREGHGIVDVIESVIRSSGFVRPRVAIEEILTSAVTIGTGGAVGAEGPIVQIGAAIASGFGSLFRLARGQMPTIIGCGAAAGISAIFNSPMGGLLFALEVILQDFSIKSVTPIVVASVVANVATKFIFARFFGQHWDAIFHMPPMQAMQVNWLVMGNYVLLGVVSGIIGVSLTRMMYLTEDRMHKLRVPAAVRPAIGGALLGMMGIAYVLIFGRLSLNQTKPIPFHIYPMPAFFGDGYGFIQLLFDPKFYQSHTVMYLSLLLAFLIFAKLIGTCLTLGSGGSGGVIAPALFLGASAGGLMGLLMKKAALFDPSLVQPEVYALVGMGAVLAAVVHAPLASIVILLELTHDSDLVLPAMLASVVATGVARVVLRDSIYTLALRERGVNVSADSTLLHRLSVEQVDLEPATVLKLDEPFQRILDLMTSGSGADFPVADESGNYCGMVTADDVRTALLDREAIPLLTVAEIVRADIPSVRTTDDLAATMNLFTRFAVEHLPVCFPGAAARVIGLISRAGLMRRYHDALAGKR